MKFETELNEADLQNWVGREETRHDHLLTAPGRRLQALLDEEPDLDDGHPLPALFHWLYFLDATRQSELGRDGHPKLGQFLPPVSEPPFNLTRRMWAGGRLVFTGALAMGEAAKRVSVIKSVALKEGQSGPLCFVTVRHTVTGENTGAVIEEEHDIVYRAKDGARPTVNSHNAQRDSARSIVPASTDTDQTIHPSPVMLFRYSALTFNGHRIHYDRDYCRDVEGYPGLVFHGPLTATLLARLASQSHSNKRLTEFSFRARAPLFDTEPFTLHLTGESRVAAHTPNGDLAMEAMARFEE